jgi:GNAT superfamily N-acetyltransferase
MSDDPLPAPRRARLEDAAAVTDCVEAAYAHYFPRIGQRPGPTLVDYPAVIAEFQVWMVADGAECAAVLVLVPEPDHMLLDNIAVHPRHQGRGLGRALLALADAEARRQGFAEMRLYTHQLMFENIERYARLGWEETGRGHQEGFDRVFFRKRLVPQ